MKQKAMKIEYDLDCMTAAQREAMEAELRALMHKHGWTFEGSGAVMESKDTRIRDIAFTH